MDLLSCLLSHSLSYIKIEQFLLSNVSLQMIVNLHRADSDRCTCIDQVSDFQREEAADVGNDLVNGKEHILRMSLLNGLAIDVQVERDLLDGSTDLFQRNKLTNDSRVVKRLAQFPRQSLLTQLTLQVACRKVDADRHLMIVTVGKPFGNVLAEPIDFDDNFSFIMQLLRKVRNEKGLAILQQSRVRPHENGRLRQY